MRLTRPFSATFGPEGPADLSVWDLIADPEQRSRLGRILEGRLLRGDLTLRASMGSVAVEAEAVLDAALTRYALLTVTPAAADPDERPGTDSLLTDPSLDDSPAIVWIKDLDGRYVRVNRRYSERHGIDDASIRGKSDAELAPAHVADRPRRRGHEGDDAEPLQLEYTVEASGELPALTVLRFPVRDLDGAPIGVCRVAAPATEAAIARSEAERLLRIERWARLSAAAIRAELLDVWQLTEIGAPSDSGSESGSTPTVDPAELARLREELEEERAARAELDTQLGEERTARAELDTQLAGERAANVTLQEAAAAAARRADELVGAGTADRSETAALESALETERARADRADRDLTATRARVAELEAASATMAAATDQVDAERSLRAGLERRLADALREAVDADRRAGAERGAASRAHDELVARAERAEAASEGVRAAGERAAAEAERARADAASAEAAAERSRSRAESLETSLANAGEVEAKIRVELVQARSEIAGLVDLLMKSRAESETAQEFAREATSRLEHERAEREQERGEIDKARPGIEHERAQLQRELAEFEQQRRELERTRGELEREHGELEREHGELERTRGELEREHGELEREHGELERERDGLERDRRELEHSRHELAEQALAVADDTPVVRPPSVRFVQAPSADDIPPPSAPTWSHQAQRALTASLAGATEWRTGLKDAIRILGSQGGWEAVIAWCTDQREAALRCAAMWTSAPDRLGMFETATWQRRQSPTASEVGRAAAASHSTWLPDLLAADDGHIAVAAREGMRAGLLVPIRHDTDAIGVLELLTRATAVPDPELLAATDAVALQLAHFELLLRRGAEPHWRIGRL